MTPRWCACQEFTGDISVSNDFASTTATDLEGISSCTLVSSSGEVWASDVSAKTLDATSNDGVVMLNNVVADNAVAVDELKIGDNDTLSATVATLVDADALIDCKGTFDQASVRADNGTISAGASGLRKTGCRSG